MGTNYYIKTETCKTCGNKEEGIHLGKSSYGWTFIFQYNGGKYYKNIKEMKEWMKDKSIEDEYGDDVSYEEFWDMVKDKEKAALNHSRDVSDSNAMIIDGYAFINCYFL